jgi:hypothetical protein
MTFEQDFLQVKGITGTEEVFGTVDPVTEEKKDMVPIDMLGTEMGEIQHELENVEDARTSLEAYDKFLTQAGPDGISRQTAAAMYIGLARIDRQLNQRSDLVASMEDNDLAEVDNRNKMAVAKGVDNKGIAGRGRQLFEKLKEIVAKLMEKLKKAWAFFTSKVKEAKDKATEVGQSLKTWAGPNGPSGGRKIDVSGEIATFVFKDGKVMSPSELQPLLKFAFEEYPGFLMKQFEQVKAAVAKGGDYPEVETFLAYEGALPDGWSIEDDGSKRPNPRYAGESNAIVKHQVRDKSTIDKAMHEVIANCEYIGSKINDNSVIGKLSSSMQQLFDSTPDDDSGMEAWNYLLKVNGMFAAASGAAAALERVGTLANLAHTRLAGLEVGQKVE